MKCIPPNWSDPYLKVKAGNNRCFVTDRKGIWIYMCEARTTLQAIQNMRTMIEHLIDHTHQRGGDE